MQKVKAKFKNTIQSQTIEGKSLKYYEILCLIYVTLIITGNTIVARLFPFHIPFTHVNIVFGAGIVFFPVTFLIQDITTEVYGYARSRRMVWLAVFMVLIYVAYTQLAIHLPTGSTSQYDRNEAYNVVFNAVPRQVLALIVSLAMGSLINDYFMSRSKVMLKGRYLWMRSIGSSMVGEAVMQVIGGVIGLLGLISFTQLLPNMALAYLYKLVWNAACIPLVYMITSALKRAEGIDVYDYEVNYTPFRLKTA